MAEFAASIIALGGVAVTTATVAKKLIELARSIKYADEAIGDFGVAIKLFADQIEIAHDTLLSECSKPNPSLIFDFLRKRKVMKDLRRQSKYIEECIGRVDPKIQSLPSSIDLVTRLKWVFFKEADIRNIERRMDSVKISLMLIMQLVSMDAALHQVQTDETREHIKSLKKHIRSQMETIRILHDVLHYTATQNTSNSFTQPPHTNRSHALGELVASLVENEAVPLPASRPSLRSRRRHRNRNRDSVAREQPSPQRNDSGVGLSPPSPTESRHSRSYSSRAESRQAQVSNHIPANTERSRDVALHIPSTVQSRVQDQEDSTGSNTSNITGSSSTPSGLESENFVVIEHDGPQQSEFIAVRPTNKFIRLSRVYRVSNSMGHIDTPIGNIPAGSMIDNGIMENLVSSNFAERCGFEVFPLGEGEEDIWVESDEWRQRCEGIVVMNCYPDTQRPHIFFPVRCFVCGYHRMPDFVFGRSFLAKRKHYMRERLAENDEPRKGRIS